MEAHENKNTKLPPPHTTGLHIERLLKKYNNRKPDGSQKQWKL